jgi:hypothetical protein
LFKQTSFRSVVLAAVGLVLCSTALWAQPRIGLSAVGRYGTGFFDQSGSEIAAFDAVNRRLYVTNGAEGKVDVIDISNPSVPGLMSRLDVSEYGEGPTHVAVYDGIVAVSVPAVPKTDPGHVLFFDASGNLRSAVQVGALPDMVRFSPDGRWVLTPNEGEPSSYCSDGVDPEGSVSIIDVSGGIDSLTQAHVRTADFQAFNGRRLPGIRIYGPGASVAQDLEPEYLTIAGDSRIAWVTLQENNALAVVDIERAQVISLVPFGTKNHALPGNGLDASDRDNAINIAQWPVRGMYLPDGIASYVVNPRTAGRFNPPLGANFFRTFLVTANEGDSREYHCLLDQSKTEAELIAEGADPVAEDVRVETLELDPAAFPNAADLKRRTNLGRLGVTVFNGDDDGRPGYERLYSLGARSFSIWSSTGQLIWDSGDAFERIIAARNPRNFNSSNDANNSFDNRSDNKGPEPEGVALGAIDDRTYAFIGLERDSGIVVYDISNPYRPFFVDYVNTRDFSPALEDDALAETDLGPESLLFVSEEDSPTGNPLLIVAYEVSGSTVIFEIERK